MAKNANPPFVQSTHKAVLAWKLVRNHHRRIMPAMEIRLISRDLCTELRRVANVRKFPLVAVYVAAEGGDISRPVQLCAPFAQRKGLHF